MSLRRCPHCKSGKVRVIDSRPVLDGDASRRRYACSCGARFTTYETVQEVVAPGDRHVRGEEGLNVLGRIAAARILGNAGEPM
jgi:hypothetical protein